VCFVEMAGWLVAALRLLRRDGWLAGSSATAIAVAPSANEVANRDCRKVICDPARLRQRAGWHRAPLNDAGLTIAKGEVDAPPLHGSRIPNRPYGSETPRSVARDEGLAKICHLIPRSPAVRSSFTTGIRSSPINRFFEPRSQKDRRRSI
jgi:hypothetical protein